MKHQTDIHVCESVILAMQKIMDQPALGHNVVQGRLHDIDQLAHLLYQDLASGVYGTEKKARRQ
jgi:hypothetical protein